MTVRLWGDEGELAYPDTKSRDVLALLHDPVLLKQDPARHQLMALPRPPSKSKHSKSDVKNLKSIAKSSLEITDLTSGADDSDPDVSEDQKDNQTDEESQAEDQLNENQMDDDPGDSEDRTRDQVDTSNFNEQFNITSLPIADSLFGDSSYPSFTSPFLASNMPAFTSPVLATNTPAFTSKGLESFLEHYSSTILLIYKA